MDREGGGHRGLVRVILRGLGLLEHLTLRVVRLQQERLVTGHAGEVVPAMVGAVPAHICRNGAIDVAEFNGTYVVLGGGLSIHRSKGVVVYRFSGDVSPQIDYCKSTPSDIIQLFLS